ncbi:MAG: ABC transporter ATP-binding protein [Pseudonocardiaceae bacterium]
MDALLRVTDLVKRFPVNRGLIVRGPMAEVHAVDGVSFSISPGETFGLVGESGCGKTTTARLVLRLLDADAGRIEFDGEDITHLRGGPLRVLRRQIQMVFQDPFASLNPRMTVEKIVAEPLVSQGRHREVSRRHIGELLERVGLDPDYAGRYPHEFSGGQRQRIGIARALSVRPKLIVCDEPVSALDVSMRAQVLNLLCDLQQELGLTYLFISHDLSVIRQISNRVGVMYLGKLVEVADRDGLFGGGLHPYTQALLSAVPIPDPDIETDRRRIVLRGDVSTPLAPPTGCRFHTRCWKAEETCRTAEPELAVRCGRHPAACHFAEPRAAIDVHS